ncbi:MAG: hypothetical protein HY082_00785 [Gammaproteobacteria bacterium]|nr:hypothetical protein [Gammaproteobacteria bacterium]
MATAKNEESVAFVKAAFGAKNRNRLIDSYFSSKKDSDITVSLAWAHVYRLLLWADQTTGLAHCYESDKCQPGKNWYSRSLAFHDWASIALKTSPANLAENIDWLFRKATADLATEVMHRAAKVAATAEKQRQPYKAKNFPKPGEDPELVSIVKEVLGGCINEEPSPEKWQLLVQRIRQYLSLENKRKNLVGEGFEDVISHVIQRTCKAPSLEVHTRRLLHEIPGFNRAKRGEKPNKVDIAVIRPKMRTLVTAKWSVRADREKQFPAEFSEYVTAESDGKPFEYVFVTNEFDPARLMRACDKLAVNAPMFTYVVHINTDAIKATYGPVQEESMRQVIKHIDNGRLISLEKWLTILGT